MHYLYRYRYLYHNSSFYFYNSPYYTVCLFLYLYLYLHLHLCTKRTTVPWMCAFVVLNRSYRITKEQSGTSIPSSRALVETRRGDRPVRKESMFWFLWREIEQESAM